MRKTLLAVALVSAFGVSNAMADVAFNAAVSSEYSYRGYSQSDNNPAFSAGADYSHASGLYVGAWASSISWLKDAGTYTKSDVEVDVYGGYKLGLTPDLQLDLGVLRYQYPGTKAAGSITANTTELYVGATYKMVGLKYSHSTTNLFGVADSKGSSYLEANANFDIAEGLQLNLHVGEQKVKNSPASDYVDYKVGVTKDFGIVAVSVAYLGTDVKPKADVSEGRGVLSISKSF